MEARKAEKVRVMTILLNDRRWWKRFETIKYIMQSGDAADLPYTLFTNALKDQHPHVRAVAAQILLQLRDPRTIPALEEAMSDPDNVVHSIVSGALQAMHEGGQ